MRWTVGTLALLSVVGGFLQFAPVWHPLTTWLDPVARPLGEPSSTQEYLTSALAIALGLAGMLVAWSIYAAKRAKAPKAVRLFERKFYFDEIYDVLWYRSGELLTRGLSARSSWNRSRAIRLRRLPSPHCRSRAIVRPLSLW